MLKKITIITFILVANISFLFAQNEKNSVYVISPAVGSYKDNSIKETYISAISNYFVNAGYTNQYTNLIGAELAKLRNIGYDDLLKAPDKNVQAVGKALKAREDRFIALVSVDEITQETCDKLKLNYNIVNKVADVIVTLSLFDRTNLDLTNPLNSAFVSVNYGKIKNADKMSEKLVNKMSEKLVNNVIKQVNKKK